MSGAAVPAVIVRDLTKRFGDFVAVQDVSFEVSRGEIFGFLGPNGAGKSTTIRMLAGLLAPSSGSASVAGIDVGRDPDAVKRRIGYMSQRFSLYGDLRVEDNLRLYAALYGLDAERAAARQRWATALTHLDGSLERRVADLAGGFRQRLALACALLHEPEVVFLDEPTGGVDPVMRRAFFELIDELASQGVTIFLTTHFLDEAEYCHRVALISSARLIALGTPTELKTRLSGRVLLEVRTETIREALSSIEHCPEIAEATVYGAGVHLLAAAGVDVTHAAQAVQRVLSAAAIQATSPESVAPTLEDVFIQLTQERAP